MGLVEVKNEKPRLFLRIYGRGYFNGSKRRLMLIWKKLEETKEKPIYLMAKDADNGSQFDLTHYTMGDKSDPEYGDAAKSDNEILCVLDEEANRLEEKKTYWVTVGYRGTDISQSVEVLPRGIYPDHEKDNLNSNVHNFLWDNESKPKTWRKWAAVKTKNGYAAAVVIVPCPSCGFVPGENGDQP